MFSSGCSVWMRTEKRAIRTPRTAAAAHGAATQMRPRAVTRENLRLRSGAWPAPDRHDRRLPSSVQSQVHVDASVWKMDGDVQRRPREHAAGAAGKKGEAGGGPGGGTGRGGGGEGGGGTPPLFSKFPPPHPPPPGGGTPPAGHPPRRRRHAAGAGGGRRRRRPPRSPSAAPS